MENKFTNEKYNHLYDLTYTHFIIELIESEEDILNKSNQTISEFISKHGNLEDIIGINNWLDKMSKDNITINPNHKTSEIRERIHNIFHNKINKLMDQGYLIKSDIPEYVCEAVFYRISANVFIDLYKSGILLDNEEKKETTNKENNKKTETENENTTGINRTTPYILATITCIVIFFLYQLITITVFGWKNGGGVFPHFILLALIVLVWKSITSKFLSKAKKETQQSIEAERSRVQRENMKKNLNKALPYFVYGLIILIGILCIMAVLTMF